MVKNAFTCCNTYYSSKLTGNTFTLTGFPFCVRTYSARRGNVQFKFLVALGQCFGGDRVHLINNPPRDSDKRGPVLLEGHNMLHPWPTCPLELIAVVFRLTAISIRVPEST